MQSFRQARSLLDTLVTEYPSVPDYCYDLAGTLWAIGDVQSTEGELQAAHDTLQVAKSHAADLIKASPDNQLYQQRMAMIEEGLSGVTAKLKQK